MASLSEFLRLYKDVDSVKSVSNLGRLFESIVFLVENDMKNDKTISAISKVLENYVEMQTERIEVIGASTYSESVKLDFTKVPVKVAEAINNRAKTLEKSKNKEKQNNEQEIIDLLKIEDDELTK